MATLLADPPGAPATEQSAATGSAGGPDVPAPERSEAAQRACPNCGSPLQGDQDWCLQCGAGAPDSLGTRAPSWRSAAAVLSAVAILVAGAATAAYAALSKGSRKPAPIVATVAQPSPPATSTPVVPATTTPTGTATAKIGTPTTIKPIVPLGRFKPPKIPTVAPTPKSSIPIVPSLSKPVKAPTPAAAPHKSPASEGPAIAGEAPQAEAIELDTNAANTYNPYAYAASNFGDPSLAIDGDDTTGWTALVEPANAPKMAEGLIVDLNTPRKIAALALSTSTPGMTVQVYGANGQAPPASITDPAWVPLSAARVEQKKKTRIKLGAGTTALAQAAKQPYRFITLWISQAPTASIGTPAAPGHVSVNSLELFPPKKK